MPAWLRVVTVALVLVFPLDSSGHWGRKRVATVAGYFYAVPTPVATYYYAVPAPVVVAYRAYYVVPTLPSPVCLPPPASPPVVAQQSTYATPTPAPPSGAPVRPFPTTKEPPRVSDSRYPPNGNGSAPYVAEKRNTDQVRVGFWNLSDRDVILRVNGQSWSLPRDKSVTLTLDRRFAWQLAGSDPQTERVPAGKSSLEILIRR
jgi:hypothetical protein